MQSHAVEPRSKPLFPASPTFQFRFEPLEDRPVRVSEPVDHTCSDIEGFLDIAGGDRF